MWERGHSTGLSSPLCPGAEPAKSLLGFYLGRACPSLISDSLMAGYLGMPVFFPPSGAVAQSAGPFVGSEQYKEGSSEPGVWGPRSSPVLPERSMALHCWVALPSRTPPGRSSPGQALCRFGYTCLMRSRLPFILGWALGVTCWKKAEH